jgi:KDO2-lipid IV(A) lauroyltransferase
MLNAILYLVLRLASWLLRILPASLMYRLAITAGWCAFYIVRDARKAVIANLAVVLGKSATSSDVRSAAISAFQNDAMNWVDTLRIGRLSLSEIQAMVQVEDWSLLEDALAAGNGLILVTLHLGNFDFVGQVLLARGYRLTVPVERMQPHALFDFLVEQRTKNGINIVPVEHAPRELIRALRSGELVGLAGDRNIAGKTVTLPVFGLPASLPTGPMSLARRTGCPVVLAVGIRVGPGRFRGIMQAVPMTFTGNGALDDAHNLATFVELMEQMVARFPGQWLVFRRFWHIDTGENTAATMEHQKRAAV